MFETGGAMQKISIIFIFCFYSLQGMTFEKLKKLFYQLPTKTDVIFFECLEEVPSFDDTAKLKVLMYAANKLRFYTNIVEEYEISSNYPTKNHLWYPYQKFYHQAIFYLLENLDDIHQTNDENFNALDILSACTNQVELIDFLMQKGIRVPQEVSSLQHPCALAILRLNPLVAVYFMTQQQVCFNPDIKKQLIWELNQAILPYDSSCLPSDPSASLNKIIFLKSMLSKYDWHFNIQGKKNIAFIRNLIAAFHRNNMNRHQYICSREITGSNKKIKNLQSINKKFYISNH